MSHMPVRAALESSLAVMRPSEADVVRRLVRDLGRVAAGSLREVAKWCDTSDATVVRACRAAGFDGFQDLKYHVLRELTHNGNSLPPVRATHELNYAADLAASLSASASALPAAARLLRTASRVALAGVGASQGIGLILTDVFFALGKQALPLPNEQTLSFALTPPTRGLVLLAISHSGETQFALRAVMEARGARVPTIGISNEPASELAKAVDVYLPTQTVERPEGSFSIAPRVCQLAVLDQLVSHLKQPNGKSVKARTPSTI